MKLQAVAPRYLQCPALLAEQVQGPPLGGGGEGVRATWVEEWRSGGVEEWRSTSVYVVLEGQGGRRQALSTLLSRPAWVGASAVTGRIRRFD